MDPVILSHTGHAKCHVARCLCAAYVGHKFESRIEPGKFLWTFCATCHHIAQDHDE